MRGYSDNVASTMLMQQGEAKVADMLHEAEATMISLIGRPDGYILFRREDLLPWVVFTAVFVLLVLFDNVILHRGHRSISFKLALVYTFFWICCAGAFCTYIYFSRGMNDAFRWATGYLLEWMLSVDNLFVFHMVFKIYGTPDHLKHKPLFWGIVGAIVFRMIFFCIGEVLMHSVAFMHILFGAFLVYTGYKAAFADDEEGDPRKNPLYIWVSQRMKVINGYDDGGAFFVKVRTDPRTGQPILPQPKGYCETEAPDGEENAEANEKVCIYKADSWYDTCNSDVSAAEQGRLQRQAEYQWYATMLILVVVCLEITDLVFAVDSVSAIVAQIPDLYLAYTACVFAMLGLRALFFVIDELIRLFSLLSYGVAAILIFIGIKLILKSWIHIPPGIVCGVLFGTLAICMVASVIHDKYFKKDDEEE